MHAWAEIEHKLNYKTDAQVPDVFQRKLFRLSAKFEEADEQFDELREGINGYRAKIKGDILSENKFNLDQDFNLDSFKLFIKHKFPSSNWSTFEYSWAFEEFNFIENTFKVLNGAIDAYINKIDEIFNDLEDNKIDTSNMSRTYCFLWFIIGLVNEEHYKKVVSGHKESPWVKTTIKWKKLVTIDKM